MPPSPSKLPLGKLSPILYLPVKLLSRKFGLRKIVSPPTPPPPPPPPVPHIKFLGNFFIFSFISMNISSVISISSVCIFYFDSIVFIIMNENLFIPYFLLFINFRLWHIMFNIHRYVKINAGLCCLAIKRIEEKLPSLYGVAIIRRHYGGCHFTERELFFCLYRKLSPGISPKQPLPQ